MQRDDMSTKILSRPTTAGFNPDTFSKSILLNSVKSNSGFLANSISGVIRPNSSSITIREDIKKLKGQKVRPKTARLS